jgi:polyribonucleotide nucleotidyltransferase
MKSEIFLSISCLRKYFWQGLEDHVGDMDFKIAGTRSGITAIQLDIKPCGIPLEILCEALEPALIARTHILEQMEKEIREPNTEQKENAPRKGFFSIQREYVGRLIGPQGSNVKNIERVTGDDWDFDYIEK